MRSLVRERVKIDKKYKTDENVFFFSVISTAGALGRPMTYQGDINCSSPPARRLRRHQNSHFLYLCSKGDVLGLDKQAKQRRPGDEPFS